MRYIRSFISVLFCAIFNHLHSTQGLWMVLIEAVPKKQTLYNTLPPKNVCSMRTINSYCSTEVGKPNGDAYTWNVLWAYTNISTKLFHISNTEDIYPNKGGLLREIWIKCLITQNFLYFLFSFLFFCSMHLGIFTFLK